MSRIGKMPITVPSGMEVKVESNVVTVKKGNETLTQNVHPDIKVNVSENEITLERENEMKTTRSLHGLYRSLINNMVQGLEKSFQKTLKIDGIGYRVEKQGKKIILTVGLSHTVEMEEPEGVTYEVPDNTTVVVKGADKQMVGEMAAKIRAVRPPEPYKGKGIRYDDEVVQLKEGKTGA